MTPSNKQAIRKVSQVQTNSSDIIRLKNLNEKYNKERKKLLIWIVFCFLILVSIIGYAASRAGGIQRLISGERDIVTNTINNVGSIVSNPSISPTPKPTIFTFDVTPLPIEQKFLSQDQNTLVISEFARPYNVKVRKGTYILFINSAQKKLGLEFSDGRRYRFTEGEQQNLYFGSKATITFRDVIDGDLNDISGTITVIE